VIVEAGGVVNCLGEDMRDRGCIEHQNCAVSGRCHDCLFGQNAGNLQGIGDKRLNLLIELHHEVGGEMFLEFAGDIAVTLKVKFDYGLFHGVKGFARKRAERRCGG
jgi:hypothetical protein